MLFLHIMNLILLLILFFTSISQTTSFFVSDALECKINTQDPSKVAYTITVSKSGGGNFTTVTDALNSIPSGNDQWIKILVNPGIYKEKIEISRDKQCIVLEGHDRSTTIITNDAHATTFESVTFINNADNFVARRITFRNSYNLANNMKNGQTVAQAVAYRALGDKQAYFSCGFEGYQDTLWDDRGRHYFHSCHIKGAIDFIWGNGQSVYEQSKIEVIGEGYVTAQGRESINQTSGYVLRNCVVTGRGKTHLGRPYRQFARVIFIESKFDDIIYPEGWHIWDKRGHEEDITFAEVNCKGPGANTSKRVKWMKTLNSSEVSKFSTQAFIDEEGWIKKLP